MSYILIFCLLAMLEAAYIWAARRLGIVDVPNERSSHSLPVARGGGIVLFLAAVVWWVWTGCGDWMAMLGFSALAAVSFADDLRPMPVSWRLATQLVATALILCQTAMMPSSAWAWTAAIIAGVGLINAFNFMDGINGLLGLYSLMFFAAAQYVNFHVHPGFVDPRLLWVMMMACAIFCFFNFRARALCFAGDVGAIVAGGVALCVLARLMLDTGNLGWLCLVAVFAVDVALTLARRILRRQNIFMAHRMHGYQIAHNERRMPQLAVAALACALQAAIDIPMLWFGYANLWYLLGVCAALAILYRRIIRLPQ